MPDALIEVRAHPRTDVEVTQRMSTITDLKEVLAAIVGDPELTRTLADDASLLSDVSDVSLDSLELLQFMLEIEASLGVEINFEQLDYGHLGSLRDLAAFLDTMPQSMHRLTGP